MVFTLFFCLVYWCMLCISCLIRRHWEDYEKLVYPLTVPVVQLTQEKAKSQNKPESILERNLILLGALPPVFFGMLSLLNSYFPAVPATRLRLDLGQYFKNPPLHALGIYPSIILAVDWLVIGIGYFIPLDVTFSIWFFSAFFKVQQVFCAALGIPLPYGGVAEPFWRQQALGAGLGLFIMYIWMMKYHLKQVLTRSFLGSRGNDDIDDSNEPLPYTVAVFGLLIGFIFLVISARYLFGISMFWSTVVLGVTLAMYVSGSRVRAEVGFPHNTCQMGMFTMYLRGYAGTDSIDFVSRTNMLGYYNTLTLYGFFGGLMPLSLEFYKMAGATGMKRRSITYALLIVFVFASVVGFITALPLVYDRGMTTTDNFKIHMGLSASAGDGLAEAPRNIQSLIAVFASAIFVMVLSYLRTTFVWWPFNPIGYFLSTNEWGIYMWSGFMIVWLVKGLILRFGGVQYFKRLQPVFLGMVLGSISMTVLSSIVGIIHHLLT